LGTTGSTVAPVRAQLTDLIEVGQTTRPFPDDTG
jgi:hypothetical protein